MNSIPEKKERTMLWDLSHYFEEKNRGGAISDAPQVRGGAICDALQVRRGAICDAPFG